MLQPKIESLLSAALSALGVADRPAFKIDIPPRPAMGDYASNAAILAARLLSKNPMEIAQSLVDELKRIDQEQIFKDIQIAKPGFINFFLSDKFIQLGLKKVLEGNGNWGKGNAGQGKRVLLEFVSANPTGPLHVGHGRWAVIGDVIGRLLSAAGYNVEKEFYVNNVGNQASMLWESVKAVREGRPLPEGGYGGWYIKDVKGESKEEALESILVQQKETLNKLGVKFDRFYYESDLHSANKVSLAIEKLKNNGKTFVEDGAIWFKSQEMGDDKNRVLIRADGLPTYFAADIAYHLDKFNRGYEHLIDIWGTDHHGYVHRLRSALTAMGMPVEHFEIIIGQLVTLYRGDEPIRMSKRTGEMITIEEVVDEIGADAVRFFFSATDVNSHLDFDLELAKKQSNENPVYYVQYGHARICSILNKSEIRNPKSETNPNTQFLNSKLEELTHPAERTLILKLLAFPDLVEAAARLRHPHRITEYGKELATCFHHFYEKCRVLGSPSRLVLVDATRIVLRNTLQLLGISAPEKM